MSATAMSNAIAVERGTDTNVKINVFVKHVLKRIERYK